MSTNNNQDLIKLITDETNLDSLSIEPKNWDADIGGVPYQVIRIKGYVHTLGGRYGQCDLWAYPRAEKMSVKNLIQFNAYNPVCWGISYRPKNYMCYEKETRNSTIVTVTRNGQKFCTCSQRGMNAGIDQARAMINQFTKHPLGLNSIDYDKKAVGRHIYYRGTPAIITRYLREQAMIMIKADGDSNLVQLPIYPYEKLTISLNKEGELKVDILDPDIAWFRGEEPEPIDPDLESFNPEDTFKDLDDKE